MNRCKVAGCAVVLGGMAMCLVGSTVGDMDNAVADDDAAAFTSAAAAAATTTIAGGVAGGNVNDGYAYAAGYGYN